MCGKIRKFAATNEYQLMTQLVVTLKDQSYLPNIRRIVKSLQGVESVSTTRKELPFQARTKAHVSRKRKVNTQKNLAVTVDDVSDPLEALDAIGRLVQSTGKTTGQLIDDYLKEKYDL